MNIRVQCASKGLCWGFSATACRPRPRVCAATMAHIDSSERDPHCRPYAAVRRGGNSGVSTKTNLDRCPRCEPGKALVPSCNFFFVAAGFKPILGIRTGSNEPSHKLSWQSRNHPDPDPYGVARAQRRSACEFDWRKSVENSPIERCQIDGQPIPSPQPRHHE